MGCYAAIPALGAVGDYVVARGRPAVLLCLELTSLHLQPPSAEHEQFVVHALFSDAAAAVAVLPGTGGGLELVDVAALTDSATADHMTWEITGRSAAAGRYRSAQHFTDEVLRPFGARFAAETPFRPVDVRSVLADGDTVVVVWDGEGTTTAGTTYRNTYAWFLTLREGRVVDGTAFYDSLAIDELWERVSPDGAGSSSAQGEHETDDGERQRHRRHDQALGPAARDRVQGHAEDEVAGEDPDADVGHTVRQQGDDAGGLEHQQREQGVEDDRHRAADPQPRGQDDVLPAPREPAQRCAADQRRLEDGEGGEQDDPDGSGHDHGGTLAAGWTTEGSR
jgi:ketosteroid isomerase-like protein